MADEIRLTQQWRSTKFVETTNDPVSPVIELRYDGSSATRTYIIEYETWTTAAQDFLGYAQVVYGQDDRNYISRITPHAFPPFTFNGQRTMFATQITRIEPLRAPGRFGARTGRNGDAVANYKYAKMTVVYETLPFDILPDERVSTSSLTNNGPDEAYCERYMTIKPTPSTSALTLPYDAFKFLDGTATKGSPPKLVPEADFQLTWHHVPTEAIGIQAINPNASRWPIDEALGCVNADEIILGGLAEGTLLFVSVDPQPLRSPYGNRIWNIGFRFKYFREGHNKILKFSTSGSSYSEIISDYATNPASNYTTKQDNRNPFNWANFAPLFRPPPRG